jgi:2,3-bisphosphoglycerate-independent phosphoglycerate mutase
MKYVVVLGDGMADLPDGISGMTPLDEAKKPSMDRLAASGQTGLVQTIPEGLKPGSDVANLSVMGYPPELYYSGRSPLEALSMGIAMEETDVALRCNLVTLSDEAEFASKTMIDYSAGEITTEESKELMDAVQNKLGSREFRFYSGVSYRHCLIYKNGNLATALTPPHDILDRSIAPYLPAGTDGERFLSLIKASGDVLKNHPVNQKRIKEGKRPATHIWLWGAGFKPRLDDFYKKYGLRGAVISAVDLLKGIARGAGMQSPDVLGATGNLHTNAQGKVDAVKKCLENGCDYVYLHVEAPDECGHQGDRAGKIKAIEMVDAMLGQIWDYLDAKGEPYVIALLPDHATPLRLRTHTSRPVPYTIYKSEKPCMSGLAFTEKDAQRGVYLPTGQNIIQIMLEK